MRAQRTLFVESEILIRTVHSEWMADSSRSAFNTLTQESGRDYRYVAPRSKLAVNSRGREMPKSVRP